VFCCLASLTDGTSLTIPRTFIHLYLAQRRDGLCLSVLHITYCTIINSIRVSLDSGNTFAAELGITYGANCQATNSFPVDQCSPIKRHPPKFRQGNGDLFDTLCNHYKLPPQNCHHHLCGQTSGLFMEKINIQLSQYKNMKRSMNKYKTDPPFAVLLRYFFNNTLTNMRSQMNPMGAALHH
jgi:hypothetical protein